MLVASVIIVCFFCMGQSTFAGSVVGWGDNRYGQADPCDGNDFVAIAAGLYHSLALKSDGCIAGWGISDDSYYDYGQTIVPSGNDFVAIAAGKYHSLALKSDGSIAAWGWNHYGQCSNIPGEAEQSNEGWLSDQNDFVAITACDNHSLALKADGSIIPWGCNGDGQCDVPQGYDFVAIAAGDCHSLALKADRSLVAWGCNDHGQCDVPQGNNFLAIAAGGYRSLALKTDGSIVGWGRNWVGAGDVPDDNDFVAIAAGGLHSLALKSDRSLVAWGWNYYRQCSGIPGGADPCNGRWRSVQNNFVAIAAGSIHSLAIVGLPPPRLTLIDPNGGETLITGNTYTINWVGPNTISQVLIDYSADNGVTWTPVTPPNWGNTGSYNWLVPKVTSEQCELASKECLVRISAVNNLTFCGTSAKVFTIYKCRLPANVAEEGDLNNDCRVDESDLGIFLDRWLECGNPLDPACDCFDPNCIP